MTDWQELIDNDLGDFVSHCNRIDHQWIIDQLERDGFLAEFSTDDHRLILIIASDKNGVLPWEEGCESYWPQMCPPPLAAMAQMATLGEDTLLSKLEVDYKINK